VHAFENPTMTQPRRLHESRSIEPTSVAVMHQAGTLRLKNGKPYSDLSHNTTLFFFTSLSPLPFFASTFPPFASICPSFFTQIISSLCNSSVSFFLLLLLPLSPLSALDTLPSPSLFFPGSRDRTACDPARVCSDTQRRGARVASGFVKSAKITPGAVFGRECVEKSHPTWNRSAVTGRCPG